MEALTRLVADSLARHGFDRPVDPRRLQWSRWFRCDSPHSLLVVPSKPGIFALAEEILDLGPATVHGAAAAEACPERAQRAEWVRPVERSSAVEERRLPQTATNPCSTVEERRFSAASSELNGARALAHEAEGCASQPPAAEGRGGVNPPLGGAALQRCELPPQKDAALAAEGRRMLAVLQFSEDDNMAFVLDRMFTYVNPMRSRLHSGNCFVRFVVVEDHEQRRSICAALNQWMRNSAEKASGLPTDFSSSLELAWENVAPVNVALAPSPAMRFADAKVDAVGPGTAPVFVEPHPDSSANKNLHCPHPLPSGF
jgi:hypothetical protein